MVRSVLGEVVYLWTGSRERGESLSVSMERQAAWRTAEKEQVVLEHQWKLAQARPA